MEEALKLTSSETLKRITESLAQQAKAEKEREAALTPESALERLKSAGGGDRSPQSGGDYPADSKPEKGRRSSSPPTSPASADPASSSAESGQQQFNAKVSSSASEGAAADAGGGPAAERGNASPDARGNRQTYTYIRISIPNNALFL